MRTTRYFEEQVLRKRPYIELVWCVRIVSDPVRKERQPDGRVRYWGYVPELGGRALRVITLADGTTIHTRSRIGTSRGKIVRLFYYPETDSLYVEFQDRPSVDTKEIGPEIRLDLDDAGRPVGLDIDHASLCLDLSVLEAQGLPHVGARGSAAKAKRSKRPRTSTS